MVNETVARPGRPTVIPVAAFIVALLVALPVTGHHAGPWWAWFPLFSGIVLLGAGYWLDGRPSRVADISARSLLLLGGPCAATGVLLLFTAMTDGYPALVMCAGVTLAAVSLRPIARASAADTAVRGTLVGWGGVGMLTGAVLLAHVAGAISLTGVRWWIPLEFVFGAVPIVFGARIARRPTGIVLIALGALTAVSGFVDLIQNT